MTSKNLLPEGGGFSRDVLGKSGIVEKVVSNLYVSSLHNICPIVSTGPDDIFRIKADNLHGGSLISQLFHDAMFSLYRGYAIPPSVWMQSLSSLQVLLHYIITLLGYATRHNVEILRLHDKSFGKTVQRRFPNHCKALNFSMATEAGTNGVTVTVHT